MGIEQNCLHLSSSSCFKTSPMICPTLCRALILSSVWSKSFCKPLISNRKAFSFASHSLDSKSLVLNKSSAWARSSSDITNYGKGKAGEAEEIEGGRVQGLARAGVALKDEVERSCIDGNAFIWETRTPELPQPESRLALAPSLNFKAQVQAIKVHVTI